MTQTIGLRGSLPCIAFLAFAISSCNPAGQPASGPAPDNGTPAGDAIVYVNSDSLLANYQFFKDLQTDLEEQGKQLENQISSKTADFQKKVGSYQQNAATMTATERQNTEQSLGQAQQEIQALQQKLSQEMMQAEQQANDSLHTKVSAFLKDYAALNDYKFVLTYSRSNNAVLFADSTLEVTDEVLNGLNAAYAKEKE